MPTAQATPMATSPAEDLYRALNVPQTASVDDLKKAINRELRLWSNRTNAPQIERRQEAERMVKLLEQAEAILLDPSKRSAYDRQRALASTPERALDDSDLAAKEDLVQEARQLLADGQVADALFVAEKATQLDGNNAEAWAVLAQARFRWGDIDDSVYEYRRAIKLRPNEAAYYFDLGSVYESADRPGDAMQQYQRAAQIEPTTAMFRAAIGVLLLKQEEYKEGIATLEQCVAEEPQNDTFQWFLAIAYADSACLNWVKVPEGGPVPAGYYATEREQVNEAEMLVNKASKLRFKDPELTAHLNKCREDITSMRQRRFHGSIAGPVIGGLLYTPAFGLGVVLLILYFIAAKPPQFAINRERLQGKTTSAEDNWRFASAETTISGKLGSWFIGNVFTGLGLPIMVLYNFIKNYTGKNAV